MKNYYQNIKKLLYKGAESEAYIFETREDAVQYLSKIIDNKN